MQTVSKPDDAPEIHPPVSPPSARRAPIPPTLVPRRTRRLRTSAVVWLGIALCLMMLTAVLDSAGLPAPMVDALWLAGVVVFFSSIVLALTRAARGIVELVRPREGATLGLLGTLGNLFMAGLGMFVAYLATVGFSRGRQLRRRGHVLLPGLRPNGDWTAPRVVLDGCAGAPDGLADQWRENGRTEHASVAAFARLTLDLMALGAPPDLVAAASRDALDEIRHAELCFSLASGLDGKLVSPGPFPEAQRVSTLPRSRTLALAKLAVDSLVDGALHEGVSARIIARLAQRCEVTPIRAMLKEIAADEGRHAAHGWTVVEWCLDEGGRPVEQALLGAVRVLPEQMRSARPKSAVDGAWERWGIHGHTLEAREYGSARANLVERVRSRVSRQAA